MALKAFPPPAEVSTEMIFGSFMRFSVYPPCVFAPGGYFYFHRR